MLTGSLFNQLTVFHAIASEGSISAAAKKLNIAAPSVSQALKALEEEIGLTLFHRTTRTVSLSDAGRSLLEATANQISSLEFAVESIKELGSVPSGNVRLTLPRFVFQCFLQPVYAEFCRRYPDINLEISINDGTVDILREGFDAGIRFGNRIEDDRVAKCLIAPFKQGLYASKDYVALYGLPEKPEDLLQHKLIDFRFPTAKNLSPLLLIEQGEEISLHMPSALIVNDIDVMADAIRQGVGIGRIFDPVYARLSERDKFMLVPVLPAYWQTWPAVYIYFLQTSQKARRVRVFVDYLLANLR